MGTTDTGIAAQIAAMQQMQQLGSATGTTGTWPQPYGVGSQIFPYTETEIQELKVAGMVFNREDLKILRKIIDAIKIIRKENGESDVDQAVEDAVAALK